MAAGVFCGSRARAREAATVCDRSCCGDRAKKQLAQDVVAASDGTAAVSPPTTIADLVSLTKAAALMISGDTGPMHIAGAVGTPLVGIFGPTDPKRNGPWAEDDLTVSRYRCVRVPLPAASAASPAGACSIFLRAK